MADASAFNILPSSLRLGAVLARGSPGVTLYLADLQLGKHATKVVLTWPSDCTAFFKQPQLFECCAGGSEEVAHKLCPICSRRRLS